MISEVDAVQQEKSWLNILQQLPVGFLTISEKGEEISFVNNRAKKLLKIKDKKEANASNILSKIKLINKSKQINLSKINFQRKDKSINYIMNKNCMDDGFSLTDLLKKSKFQD